MKLPALCIVKKKFYCIGHNYPINPGEVVIVLSMINKDHNRYAAYDIIWPTGAVETSLFDISPAPDSRKITAFIKFDI